MRIYGAVLILFCFLASTGYSYESNNKNQDKLSLENLIHNIDTLNSKKINCSRQVEPQKFRKSLEAHSQEVIYQNFEASLLSEHQLQMASNYFQGKANRYGLTNSTYVRQAVCAQRAMMVAHDLQKDLNIKSLKIFAIGEIGPIKEKLGPIYRWQKYHVANLVLVRKDNQMEPFIIDKLLSDQPLSLQAWKDKLTQNNPKIEFKITDAKTRLPSEINKPVPPHFDIEWAETNIAEVIRRGSRL